MDVNILAGTGIDFPCSFVTGPAGTGKTFQQRQRIQEDPCYGRLCATTGIAAVNLDTVTLNSVLGYFDTESLEDIFQNGSLEMRLAKLAQDSDEVDDDGEPIRLRNLVIDEVSMMPGEQLDIIKHAVGMVNERRGWHDKDPFGIVLTGDFCQLPPIKAKWAFEADCWPAFEANTTRLTKIYRQSDLQFLEAINLIRSGRGPEGVDILKRIPGVEFASKADQTFQGTTIIPKNDGVERFNWLCHQKINGKPFTALKELWGRQRPEWQKQIPPFLTVKEGAYVMILANDSPDFTYANGDCGYVRDFNGMYMVIELVRNGQEVAVPIITRGFEQRHIPDEILAENPGMSEKDLREEYALLGDDGTGNAPIPYTPDKPFYSTRRKKWVTGQVRYMPVRLAYATTVHKSQGLTLDKVQIDIQHGFFGAPAMAYVALSRCKGPQGLRIIGTPALLASRVNTDPKVSRWL